MGERGIVGGFWHYWQHMTVRFLPTQEWSVGVTGVCGCILATVRATIQRRAAIMPYSPIDFRSPVDHSCEGRNLTAIGGIAALITPPLAAHESEIPAFAGMVFRGTGELRADGSVWAYFAGGMRIGSVFWHLAAADNRRRRRTIGGRAATIPRPHTDHSCEGRNLTVLCCHMLVVRQFSESPKLSPPAANLSKLTAPR